MSPGVRARRVRERLIAIGLTFSAYGAIFFFLTRPSAIPAFTPFDNGGDVAITLAAAGQSSTAEMQAVDRLEALARSYVESGASDMPPPSEPQPRTTLSELLGETDEASAAQATPAGGPRSSGVVRTGLVGDPGAQLSGGRRNVTVGPDGQVPPCWRRPERRVPVRISIILDHQGGLIGPPQIVRSGNAPEDPAQRAAEVTAMRAMAGCAPFTLASVAGQYRSFELDFSKERNWIRPTGLVDLR